MIKDLKIKTYTHPWTVILVDEFEGVEYVVLKEGESPKVKSPQLTNNDEFDRYQLLLSEAFRIFKKV
jgi:hypothetical protein